MSELFVQKSIDDGDLDIALNYLDENYQELQYISDLYRSIIYQTEGNYCKALEYGKRAEAASRNVDQYYCDCSHIAMAYAYLKLGELNNAELCINKAHDDFEQMEIVESPNTIYWLRTMHQIIAGIYGLTGRYSESIKALEYGLKLTLQMKTDTVLPGIYNNLGFANMLTGHLDMAHDFYYMALDVCERIQNDYLKYYPQSNLGNYYFIRGEIEKAERFHDDALHLALKLNHSGNIVSQFRDLSQIYRIKGENARSLEYLQKSLEIAKKIGNQGTLASILVLLVDESLEIGNSDDADQYYQTLLEVSHHQDSTKIIEHLSLYANALIQKSKNRIKPKSKAMTLLNEVIQEAVVDHYTLVYSMLYMCELLLFEARSTGEKTVWDELHELIQRLRDLATKNNLNVLQIEVLGLEANIAAIEGDFTQAITLCDQAIALADKVNLTILKQKMRALHDHIDEDRNRLQDVIDKKIGVNNWMEIRKIEEYLQEILKNKDKITKI